MGLDVNLYRVFNCAALYSTTIRVHPVKSLHWRHNDHDCVSNHQPYGCLLNRLFRRRSKKTSKLRVTGLCVGNSPGPVDSPHKGPVTRKMFPFDDVIMYVQHLANHSAMHKTTLCHTTIHLQCTVLFAYFFHTREYRTVLGYASVFYATN